MRPHRPGRAPPERAASRRPRRRAAAPPPRARSGRRPARARRFVATGPPRTTPGVSIRSAIGTNPVKLELVSRRPGWALSPLDVGELLRDAAISHLKEVEAAHVRTPAPGLGPGVAQRTTARSP